MTRNRKFFLHAAIALTMGANALQAGAQDAFYRWLNERGETVYSDRPPEKGIDYEVVSTTSSLKRQVAAEEGAVPAETRSTPSNEFEEVDESAAKQVAQNAARCEGARKDLEALTSQARIVVRDNEGNKRELTPEEIQVRTATTRALIDTYCVDTGEDDAG